MSAIILRELIFLAHALNIWFLEVQLKPSKIFSDRHLLRTEEWGIYKVFQENFRLRTHGTILFWSSLIISLISQIYYWRMCGTRVDYSVPLKAKLKLYCTTRTRRFRNGGTGCLSWDVPTWPRKLFCDQWSRRVVVSQLHRSPVFLRSECHATEPSCTCRIIPFKGSWIEFATDINSVMYAYIDRKKKLRLRLAAGHRLWNDKDILAIFDWRWTEGFQDFGEETGGRKLQEGVEDLDETL
jgi:DNA-directed RNA polymerase subunit beta